MLICLFYFYGRFLELYKHHRQTIDKEQYIRATIVVVTFDPHLINHGKSVLLGVVKVNKTHNIKILFVLYACSHLYAIAQLFVEGIVGGFDVRTRVVLAQVMGNGL